MKIRGNETTQEPVDCWLPYGRGIKITDQEIAALEATQLHRHEFHGDWN